MEKSASDNVLHRESLPKIVVDDVAVLRKLSLALEKSTEVIQKNADLIKRLSLIGAGSLSGAEVTPKTSRTSVFFPQAKGSHSQSHVNFAGVGSRTSHTVVSHKRTGDFGGYESVIRMDAEGGGREYDMQVGRCLSMSLESQAEGSSLF